MAGTRAGGLKSAKKIKELYGDDFYKKSGGKWVKQYLEDKENGKAKPRGFAINRDIARKAGAKGGSKSRRSKNEKSTG